VTDILHRSKIFFFWGTVPCTLLKVSHDQRYPLPSLLEHNTELDYSHRPLDIYSHAQQLIMNVVLNYFYKIGQK